MCECSEYLSRPVTMREVESFIATAGKIALTLDLVKRSRDGWRSLYRCRECGTFWEKTYPFSEAHGGGPECLIPAAPVSPAQYFEVVPDLVAALRQGAEDNDFIASVGSARGPERCTTAGCGDLRIEHSVKCLRHHFEMVFGRTFPQSGNAG